MKKLFILLLIPFSLIADDDNVKLWFKNGAYVEYHANSYWTIFHHKHNCKKCFNYSPEDDENYLCFYDWSWMNRYR